MAWYLILILGFVCGFIVNSIISIFLLQYYEKHPDKIDNRVYDVFN